MNKPAFFLLLALGLTSTAALAESIGNIATLTGKVYRRCEIVRVHPDGVSFTHSKGAAKVLFADLSQEWRSRLGYNPTKAAAYERELAEKRQLEADARAARQAELGKALAVAQQMELSRLRLAEQQAAAMMRLASYNNNAFGQSYPVPLVPAIGAVWDGGSFRRAYRGGSGSWTNDCYWNSGWGNYYGGGYNRPYFSTFGFCPPNHGVRACAPVARGGFTVRLKP